MSKDEQTLGLLMATMEPPAGMEEEFQDWYDTEHFPERAAAEGFLTAQRFTCIDGFPRFLALYDLEDNGVLQRPSYRAIAGARYSAWTQRIMPRMWGAYRADGPQRYPGAALLGAEGHAARLVLWRFAAAPEAAETTIIEGLRATYEGQPQTAQVRLFKTRQQHGIDFIGLIELHVPYDPRPDAVAAFKDSARYIDLVNTYVTYRRRAPGAFPLERS
jgi:hypothetical protein